MQPSQADAFGSDLGLVQDAIRAGVTTKRANAQDNHWERWSSFCLDHGIDPFLRCYTDPVPILQVYGQRYRDGRCAPRKKPVQAGTVSDALCAVGQTLARLGANDARKDKHGKVDYRISQQIRSYSRADPPPTRVKPLPITIVTYILQLVHSATANANAAQTVIADMTCIAFFYLLHPGEYTGTTTDDAAFALRDVALHLGARLLDHETATAAEIEAATSVTYIFTTQKNGMRGERITHGRSLHPLCCPVTATIRLLLYHRAHGTPQQAPLASYYRGGRLTPIKAIDITETLRSAATINFHRTGISASDISARSLRAGGAMALLCGKVDFDIIRMLGRWHSDAMMRYLHLQAQPIMKRFAVAMYNDGNYSFLPEETVPSVVNPQAGI